MTQKEHWDFKRNGYELTMVDNCQHPQLLMFCYVTVISVLVYQSAVKHLGPTENFREFFDTL